MSPLPTPSASDSASSPREPNPEAEKQALARLERVLRPLAFDPSQPPPPPAHSSAPVPVPSLVPSPRPAPKPTKAPKRPRKALKQSSALTHPPPSPPPFLPPVPDHFYPHPPLPPSSTSSTSQPSPIVSDDPLSQAPLELLFCGINPGQRSALLRTHFAHPTNHFWPALHLSGLTPIRHPPEDAYLLPSLYAYGLTNVVPRPTVQASELTKREIEDGVPRLFAKIGVLRPSVVVFVGIGIWTEAIRPYLHRLPPDALLPSLLPLSKSKRGEKKFTPGIQPYLLIHPASTHFPIERETAFVVVPSTSGRVTAYTLQQKVVFFSQAKMLLTRSKAGLEMQVEAEVIRLRLPLAVAGGGT